MVYSWIDWLAAEWLQSRQARGRFGMQLHYWFLKPTWDSNVVWRSCSSATSGHSECACSLSVQWRPAQTACDWCATWPAWLITFQVNVTSRTAAEYTCGHAGPQLPSNLLTVPLTHALTCIRAEVHGATLVFFPPPNYERFGFGHCRDNNVKSNRRHSSKNGAQKYTQQPLT